MTISDTIPVDSGLRPADQRPEAYLTSAVILRAGVVALILGSTLTLINQFDAVFGTGKIDLIRLCLVYATPFIVVTISQLLGAQRAARDAAQQIPAVFAPDSLLTSALSHGIPMRAVVVGALVGSANTAIVAAATFAQHGDLSTLPTALIGQAFVLPVLFGLLSQAISYRRTARALALH